MRIGVKRWQLELELSRNTFEARIPLRLKLTFYIGIVAVIGMVLLAAVCILKSLSYTQRLMQARLSQFAAMNAQQIERAVTNQATTLLDAMQSESLSKSFESLYIGNITTDKWASDVEVVVKYLFSTSLLGYQAIYLYDNSESPLFYMANPNLSASDLSELSPAMPKLLPLGYTSGAQNATQIPNNQSAILNQSASDAASASSKGIHRRTSLDMATYSGREPLSAVAKRGTPPTLNFTTSQEGVSSWLSQPQPLVGQEGNITAYSYSITVPISETQVAGSVQISQLIGYCSAVIDCSQYLYEGTDLVFNSSLLSKEMRDPWFTILEADDRHGWRYLFPTGFNFTTNSRWHTMSEFPAVAADLVLQNHQEKSIRKPGGALTHSRTPRDKKASVGYSFANLLNRQWLILLSLPQSQVEAGYRKLFKTLAGVAAAILVFVLFSAFFVTGLTTKPLLHIYDSMELRPRSSSRPKGSKEQTSEEGRRFSKQLVDDIKLFGFTQTLHANLSSRTLVSMFGSSHTDEETTIGVDTQAIEEPAQDKQECKNIEAEVASNSTDQITLTETSTYQPTVAEDIEDEPTTGFHIPSPLRPLNRWISDEFDELISEYNMMVARLTAQYTKMEDEVRLRTREARASQRSAEAANAAKSKFMMNISHELLTPMNGIMGFTATTSAESDLHAIHTGLRKIIKSGIVLQELLKELLNYSAHLANTEEVKTPFTMLELARSIHDASASNAESKGIQFEVRPTPDIAPKELADGKPSDPMSWQVESDYAQIQQICANLVSNAVKFSDPGKSASPRPRVGVHICILQSEKPVDGRAPENDRQVTSLEVMVHDNGVGISQDRLAHIFEVFVQGDDALSKRFTGTGLGLAMSKLLCERLGGHIKVYTRATIGSTVVLRIPVCSVQSQQFPAVDRTSVVTTPVFAEPRGSRSVWFTDSRCVGEISVIALSGKRDTPTIAIPAREAHRALIDEPVLLSPISEYPKGDGSQPESPRSIAPPSADFRVANAEGMRVLVADDNDLLRKLLKRYLERLGIGRVDLAASGDDVIKWVEAAIVNGTRYSIIFMDLTMPGVDGLEATRDIRRQLGYFCPVVALTGYSDADIVGLCMQAGLQKVLVKPVSQKQLAESISELVQDNQLGQSE